MVDEVSALNTAVKMIQEGIRPPVVYAATGLAKQKLRQMYQEIHGKPAIRGRVPETAHRRLKSFMAVMDATLFFRIYKDLAGHKLFRVMDSNLMIDAYRLYKESVAVHRIDATTAWFLARDLGEKTIEIRRCRLCNNEYLYDKRSDYMQTCLLCRT